ncbi:hypothetical protein [Listeria booriae]|uniref:hypothetical protein n=1 Tax=Listeria booriae TaxID=1552123 RepID=UPI001628CD0F|nr:hypothetical protein [Listeria booriae]MBC1235211.1 hypothetical protein [Listeria booriae]
MIPIIIALFILVLVISFIGTIAEKDRATKRCLCVVCSASLLALALATILI